VLEQAADSVWPQVRNTKLLYNLCLTNKLWNEVFSRSLFRKVTVEAWGCQGLQGLLACSALQHTRDLAVQGHCLPDDTADLNRRIQELLAKTPLLTGFQ
jgi:hypothetical protein